MARAYSSLSLDFGDLHALSQLRHRHHSRPAILSKLWHGAGNCGQLVAEHSSPEMLKLEKSFSKKANQQRMYDSLKWGMIALILGMAALVVVKTFALDKPFNLVGAALLFLAMGLMTYGVLSPMRDGIPGARKFPGSRS